MTKEVAISSLRRDVWTWDKSYCLDFPKASVKETAFGFLLGQSQSPFIGFAGLGRSSQPAAQIGAGCVSQVVVGQIAIRQDVVDQAKPCCGAVSHRNRDRLIQGDDWRRLDSRERVVQLDDLMPVRSSSGRGVGMNGRDRGLDRVRANRRRRECPLQVRLAFADSSLAP